MKCMKLLGTACGKVATEGGCDGEVVQKEAEISKKEKILGPGRLELPTSGLL